jgi:hypothetical protein
MKVMIKMNYQKIYNQLIQRAHLEDRKKLKREHKDYIYYENHHIVPKRLGGSDKKENLVLLTAREHFIAHKLLAFMYPDNKSVFYGYYAMANITHKREGYKISSREYDRIKKEFNFKCSGINASFYGKKHSNEFKIKASDRMKGKRNPNYNKPSPRRGIPLSQETKDKISKVHKGKKLSEDQKNKLLCANKGRKMSKKHKEILRQYRIGCPHTKEAKIKIGLSSKGRVPKCKVCKKFMAREHKCIIYKCPYCEMSSYNKGNMTRYHFDNCKYKNDVLFSRKTM